MLKPVAATPPGISALIPAAGFSSRMGKLKPLLPLGDTRVLVRCVRLFQQVGITDIVVVTGHRADEVGREAEAAGARVAHNAAFEDGMFGSFQTGVSAINENCTAFFALPADIALVRPATVLSLVAEFSEHKAAVTYPTFLGERGHPPLIRADLIPDILDHDGTGGLRTVLESCEQETREVAVADMGTMLDMDRPTDYKRAVAMVDCGYPQPAECRALWDGLDICAALREHHATVAGLALAMTEVLNTRREPADQLDAGLVVGAALTHDIGKGNRHHARVGAEMLEALGFFLAAPIVADHVDLTLVPDQPLREREIVFLADKFVQGRACTALGARYAVKLERYGHDPEARAAIENRQQRAREVNERFMAEAGCDPATLELRMDFMAAIG